MEQSEIIESITEQIKDSINITQLLSVELSENEDDTHILRSVQIIEKMLQAILENLQHLYKN